MPHPFKSWSYQVYQLLNITVTMAIPWHITPASSKCEQSWFPQPLKGQSERNCSCPVQLTSSIHICTPKWPKNGSTVKQNGYIRKKWMSLSSEFRLDISIKTLYVVIVYLSQIDLLEYQNLVIPWNPAVHRRQ